MVQESGEAHMTEAPKKIWAWPHFDGWITCDGIDIVDWRLR